MQRIQGHLVFSAGLQSYIKHFCPNSTMNGIDTYEEHIPMSFKNIVKGGMCTKGWFNNRFPEITAYYKQQKTSERHCRSVDVVGKVPAGWSTLYSNPGRGEKFFLFLKTSKPPWGSPKLPIHWILGVVSLAKKRPKCRTYHAPHLLLSSPMSGHTFPVPHTPSWSAEASDLGMTEDWEPARHSV